MRHIGMALAAGGQMKVKAILHGKSIFSARMEWVGQDPVVGKISTSVDGAIGYLNEALAEDQKREYLLEEKE